MAAEAGITCRRASYWAKAGLLHPDRIDTGNAGQGGITLEWDEAELRAARLMGRLTAAGVTPSLAAVIARKWPGIHEIAPGIRVQVDAEPEPGTVTEWGVRYALPPGAPPGAPAEARVDRAADRETAERMMTGAPHREKHADDTLVRHEVGPWKETPDGTA